MTSGYIAGLNTIAESFKALYRAVHAFIEGGIL
jgi:hypothetical protein